MGRQRQIIAGLKALGGQVRRQLAGSLWELVLPPLPLVRGTAQAFDVGVLAVQGTQQYREARFELR